MPRLTLALLGGFEARLDDNRPLRLPRKSQALLAYLALHPRAACGRAELAAVLWAEFAETQARASVRKALVGLRKAFGASAGAILETKATVVLGADAVVTDAVTFRRLIAEASTAALEAAAALYRGELLRGLDVDEPAFEEWLSVERERFRSEALTALGTLLARHVDAGAHDAAMDVANRLLAIEAGHEPAHRALMRVFAASGRRAAALRQYQRCVEALQHDLGIEPSHETRRLYQEIVRTHAAVPVVAARVSGDVTPSANDDTTPFVGRAAELTALRSALARAASGRSEIVAILGEAGIGKTRLIAQATVEATATGARVIVGHAYPSEQIVPCAPWIDAFGAAAIGGADDAGRLADTVVALVERHAAAQPLVLVFEDVHWADELTVRLVGVVARRLRARPLLLVISARDDEIDDRPALRQLLRDFGRETPATTLTLTALSSSETAALVRASAHVLDGASHDALTARVWRTSEGHPLMAVETLRTVQQGAPLSDTESAPLPARVRDLIAARLDRLGERARAVVATAAVIGRAFDFALLERAAGCGDLATAEAVEELVRRRVLRGAGAEFEFTHERIREAAYDAVLLPRRRVLHRQVAEALEALYAGELDVHQAALGAHFHAAGVWDKAVRYLRGAGVWALARAAHREALASFEQAIAAAAELPDEPATTTLVIDLQLDFLRALMRLGDYVRPGAHLDEAERLAMRAGDLVREGRVNAYRAYLALATGTLAEVRRIATRVRDLGARAPDHALVDVGDLFLGYEAVRAGDYLRARAVLGGLVDRMPAAAELDTYGAQTLPYVGARGRLGVALAQLGDFAGATQHHDDAIAFAESVGHRYSVISAWRERIEAALIQGDPGAAASAELALALAEAWEAPAWRPVLESALGWARVLDGRIDEGRGLLRGALAQAEARGGVVYMIDLLLRLGETAAVAGDLGDARHHADRALALARERGERGGEAWALRLHGEIARRTATPDVAAATDAYERALAMAAERGMRPLAAHCHHGLGALDGASRRADAEAHLRTAAAMFADMAMRPGLDARPAARATTPRRARRPRHRGGTSA